MYFVISSTLRLRPVTAAVVLAIAGIAGGSALGDTLEEQQRSLNAIRFRCGANSVYLLLRAHGCECSFESIEDNLDVGNTGASLLNLRNVAAQNGLECVIRRLPNTCEALNRSHLPLIALLNESFNGVSTGHYVLVYEVVESGDRKGVWFIDATNGKKRRYYWDRFPLKWSGYVLEPSRAALTSLLADKRITTALCLFGGALFWKSRTDWAVRRVAAKSGALCAFVISTICICPNGRAVEIPSDKGLDIWRNAQRDGVNSIYMMLHLFGRPVAYRDLEEAMPDAMGRVSLLQLKDKAHSFGLPLRVIHCGPKELAKLSPPYLVHVKDIRNKGGQFGLVYQSPTQEAGKIGVIWGGTAVISEMSLDEFRRAWSGVALLPEREPPNVSLAIAANAFLLSAYLWQSSRISHSN